MSTGVCLHVFDNVIVCAECIYQCEYEHAGESASWVCIHVCGCVRVKV